MKKYVAIILFITFYGCQEKDNQLVDVEFRVFESRIKKDYLDIKTKEGRIKNNETHALISTSYFKFTRDSLFIEPEFGKRFFNDSVFAFKIEGDVIKLEGSSGKKEIILSGRREDDYIDIYFENDIFERLGLAKFKKTSKSNNSELVGIYSLGGYSLGDRFQNNPEYGHDYVKSKLKGEFFEFKDNDSLIMSDEFGKAFFNESVFYYTYDGKTLALDGKIGRFEIPVKKWNSLKTFDLQPTDGYFTSLIISAKEKK